MTPGSPPGRRTRWWRPSRAGSKNAASREGRGGLAGPQQPGRRRPASGVLAHRGGGGAGPALLRRGGCRGGPGAGRPRARPRARTRHDLGPHGAGRRRRRCARRRRDLPRPSLRRRPGPVHLRLDGDTQGGAAHAARPELEGHADGARARPRLLGRGAHAGADGPHLGPAQRRVGAGRGRDALGPRPPLPSRAGPRPGGARADHVPRRATHLLHRHGTCACGGAGRRRVVGPARVERRRLRHAGVRRRHARARSTAG